MSVRITTVHGVVLDTRIRFTTGEFCRVCGVEQSMLRIMVEEGIIEPESEQGEWRFHGESLVRAKRALRLVQDLGVNWPGAALALDLLDELEQRRPS